MVPVPKRLTLALTSSLLIPLALAGPARAQENPTTPGAIPNPGSYQGSLELQRREQEQSQQYQQPQGQPNYGAPQRGGYGPPRGAARGPTASQVAAAAFQRGDYPTAYRLVLPLAQAGDRIAQYNLGLLYKKGLGVRQDDATAVVWYQRSAAQGWAQAENDLAMAYAFGQGVPKSYVQSYVWLTRAAATAESPQDRNAILANRGRLVAQMGPAELAQAQRLAGHPAGSGPQARR
jgi:hypothetical protein